MLSLQTVFTTLKELCQAKYLRTEDMSEAGYLWHRFHLCENLEIIVRFSLKTNEVEGIESCDEIDWDNDRGLLGCFINSEADISAFCLKAMERQLLSLSSPRKGQ